MAPCFRKSPIVMSYSLLGSILRTTVSRIPSTPCPLSTKDKVSSLPAHAKKYGISFHWGTMVYESLNDTSLPRYKNLTSAVTSAPTPFLFRDVIRGNLIFPNMFLHKGLFFSSRTFFKDRATLPTLFLFWTSFASVASDNSNATACSMLSFNPTKFSSSTLISCSYQRPCKICASVKLPLCVLACRRPAMPSPYRLLSIGPESHQDITRGGR